MAFPCHIPQDTVYFEAKSEAGVLASVSAALKEMGVQVQTQGQVRHQLFWRGFNSPGAGEPGLPCCCIDLQWALLQNEFAEE